MSTVVANDPRSYASRLGVTDLVIHEFNQWTNPNELMLSPTTTCWCRFDSAVELAE